MGRHLYAGLWDHLAAGDDGAWSADLQARTRYRVIKVADQARWAGIAMTWRAALAGGSVPRTDPK